MSSAAEHTRDAPPPTWTTGAGTDFIGGLNGLFSMYNEIAERQDRKTAESWKGEADNMLHAVRPSFHLFPQMLADPAVTGQPFLNHGGDIARKVVPTIFTRRL